MKRSAIRAARRTVVLADRTKLGRVTFATIAPLSEIDIVVTDAPGDDVTLAELDGLGIEIVAADPARLGPLPAVTAGRV